MLYGRKAHCRKGGNIFINCNDPSNHRLEAVQFKLSREKPRPGLCRIAQSHAALDQFVWKQIWWRRGENGKNRLYCRNKKMRLSCQARVISPMRMCSLPPKRRVRGQGRQACSFLYGFLSCQALFIRVISCFLINTIITLHLSISILPHFITLLMSQDSMHCIIMTHAIHHSYFTSVPIGARIRAPINTYDDSSTIESHRSIIIIHHDTPPQSYQWDGKHSEVSSRWVQLGQLS
jgi:hypothetical protein